MIELCRRDLFLSLHNGYTVLQLVAPVPIEGKRAVRAEGSYLKWTHQDWENLRRRARGFGRHYPDLDTELKRVEAAIRRGQIGAELWVTNDDSPAPQRLRGLHTLGASFSRERNYIWVRGRGTFKIKEELRRLGLAWDPEHRAWWTEFSERKLVEVIEFLRLHDRKRDPVEAGYEECSTCGRWNPSPAVCPCTLR